MMENNNDWFENLNYPSTDHQQQTLVTKHDLELLHKKIIATDLIVQKYQEVNKALLRLQIENDDLKQQIEQITNECCIFSKQVTECTQECDNLKEQIEISNSDKRELHQQIRLLQDENTNNHHEIMVLRQFESLKDTNDQLTKTVDRQQKTIGKLQLQLQRKSPVVYKPVKNKQEPSETDIALTKSQKSVRELKLALGRLVNFIKLSKIEIPTALHIRPVLKAHDITDDFLEIEGDIPRKPVKKVSKSVVSQTDDDDDDDQGDFIDINHSIPAPPPPPLPTIHTTDVIEKTPLPSRQEQKKSKPTKKSRRKKDTSAKLNELANELEIALSQSDQPTSFLSDDDNIHKSDKHQSLKTSSTITISKEISFFSEDETEILTPVIKQTMNSLQVDSIIPMEVEILNTRTTYMSFLSEDDDENNKSISSMSTQEYISPLKLNKPTVQEDIHSSQVMDQSSSIVLQPIEPIPENIQLNTKDQTTTSSSISVNTLDSHRIQIVLRLLNVLTHVPVPLKPLRLVRRRIRQKPIPQKIDSSVADIPEQSEAMDENNTILENQVSINMEEPTKSIEEINQISENQVPPSIEEQLKPSEEIHDAEESNIVNNQLPEQLQTFVEENHDVQENNTIVNKELEESQTSVEESSLNEQSAIIKESSVISIPQESIPTVQAIQPKPIPPFKRPLPSLVIESRQKSSLKPFHISIITRLLTTLTNLPVKPLILPMPFPLRKRKRKSVVKKLSVPLPPREPSTRLSRQPSTRSPRSPLRMQTRSLNSIKACITRCNQPVTIPMKRTATESISPSSTPSNKRMKSITIEQNTNEYDLINKFLNISLQKMNDELEKFLRRKLDEDISLFIDHLYRILSEFMMEKCKIEHVRDKKSQSYEKSITLLLTFIHNQSSRFEEHFIKKLNQTFEHEIQQQPIPDHRIKILNRLFIITCSIFASSSSVIIYTRLFDIGYSLSHDIFVDAMSYISIKYSSLISINNPSNSSNILLRRILIDMINTEQFNISYEYLDNHFRNYLEQKCDQQDLIRSFILIFRHCSWSWCSNSLCSNILFPLVEKINDQYQRLTFLMILQTIFFVYKDNADFQRDINFHKQIKQRLEALMNMNNDECTVRHNIVSILNRYLLNK